MIEKRTEEFANEILSNANKVFRFQRKPNDDYCFWLASINLFGIQTVIINAGKNIGKDIVPCPGYAHAFNITCYDTAMNLCYDHDECMSDIINGLACFDGTQGKDNETWYIMEDRDKHTGNYLSLRISVGVGQ